MNRYLATIIAFVISSTCLGSDLVVVDKQQITEVSLRHLLSQEPKLEEKDLEVKLIHITTNPESKSKTSANITTQFILSSSKTKFCEKVQLSQELALLIEHGKVSKELEQVCGHKYKGYVVRFKTDAPMGPAEIESVEFKVY